jgi:hypothetical protein
MAIDFSQMKSVKLRISCHTICLLALSILLATAKTVSAQSLEWVLVDDTDTYSVVNAIAVDEATGSLYAGGKIAGSSVNLSLDGVGVDAIDIFNFSGSSNDAFVARTTTDGAVIWMKVFGDVAKTEVMDVAVGIDGNVYVTGYFKHSFTLDAYGGGTIVINEVGGGDYDIFTIGFNQDGEALWGRVDGGTKDDSGLSIVATATKIAVLGYFENDETTLCDIIPTQNTGTTDYCVMTFDYAGNPLWFSTWGSSMDDFNTSSNYIDQRPSLGNCGEELYAIGASMGSIAPFLVLVIPLFLPSTWQVLTPGLICLPWHGMLMVV